LCPTNFIFEQGACLHPLPLIHPHRLPGKTILGTRYIGYLVFGIVGLYLHYPTLGIVQHNRCNKKG
jgi:hypothetical protein